MQEKAWHAGRRDFLRGVGIAALAPSSLMAQTSAASPASLVVATEHGRLRGAPHRGIIAFKGIAYADDTGGSNRFMAPQPVTRWSGVRDALAFGDRCPQPRSGPSENAAATYGEACCVLNIYTPGVGRNAQRPVLFWIHGGGFQAGSGDSPATDGTALARSADMVVVTVNHRLNLFGFTNLAHLHPDFADSANVGQLDLVAALAWVRNNIEAFGGDPERVTLMGESGGGAKIATLSAMPAANGLYARTINMSGPGGFFLKPMDETRATTNELLRILDIPQSQPHRLQQVPVPQLLAAQAKALENLHADQLRPSIDGRNIVTAPMSAQGIALQARLPGIMTYCATEATPWLLADRRNLAIDEAQLNARIAAQFNVDAARAAAVADAYRQDVPGRTPWDMLVAITSDAMIRTPMRRAAEAIASAGQAPVYFGNFAWTSDLEGGIWGGPHAVDVPFAFGNLEHSRFAAPGNDRAQAASRNLMAAFAAFAANGNPAHPAMPHWNAHELARRPVMMIDDTYRPSSDPMRGDRIGSEMLPTQSTYQITHGKLVRGLG